MNAADGGAVCSLRIRLLGEFHVSVGGRTIVENQWRRPKAKALLKLLALQPQHQLHRDQIIEIFWSDAPQESATNSLNKIIYMVRRALEPELPSGGQSTFLLRQQDRILLRAPGTLWIDVNEFEQHANRAIRDNDSTAFEDALNLYPGDLLVEDLYEDWAWQRREQLRLLHRDLLSGLARLHEHQGNYRESIERLMQLVNCDPVDEDAHRRLMKLYAASGQRRQAQRQFELCRETLRKEIEADPEEETLQLHQRIASGEVEALVRTASAVQQSPRVVSDALAVLPFTNGNADPELEYLCDGISESLITNLSQLPGLRIMARSTVFRYKGKEADPQTVAKDLAVRSVLSGRVSQWGETLTIGVELVDGDDGSLLWGERYRRQLTDIFSVQEDISREISGKLHVELTSADRERLRKRHTEDTEAYQLYLRGRYFWNKRTGEGLEKALEYFRQAIERDPTYALAYAGLSDCFNLLGLYSGVAPRESMPKAKAAARRALQIDGSLAEAHTSLAYAKLYYDWDWNGAERAFQKALHLNPNYATAHHWYHEFLTAMGRFEEQRSEVLQARDLDPLSVIIDTEIGWGLYYARQNEEAIRELRKTLEIDPNFPVTHLILGLAYLQTGMSESAVTEIESSLALLGDKPFPLGLGLLGNAYAASGRGSDARQLLARLTDLSSQRYVSGYHHALIHTGLGENDQAFDQLRRACEERYDRLIYLKVEPLFDLLRPDPRFEQLLHFVGLNAP